MERSVNMRKVLICIKISYIHKYFYALYTDLYFEFYNIQYCLREDSALAIVKKKLIIIHFL